MELYGDLVVQDQLEIDTKKMKNDGLDNTGDHEALVRQKFLSKFKFIECILKVQVSGVSMPSPSPK